MPTLRPILSLVAVLALPAAAHAASADDLTAALALPLASQLTGARDAPRFAWVVTREGRRSIVTARPGETPRELAATDGDDGVELSDLTLSADGAALAYVRGGDGEFPDDDRPNPGLSAEAPEQAVWLAGTTGGAPQRLGQGHSPAFAPDGRVAFAREHELFVWTPGEGAKRVATLPGHAGSLRFTPDGARLVFVEARGDHAFAAVLDLAAARLRYLAPMLGYAAEPAMSADGKRLAFVRYRDPPAGGDPARASWWDIVVADLATGAAKPVFTAPPGAGGQFAATRGRDLYWTVDNRLVFPWERSGFVHAWLLDPAKPGVPPRDLTPGEQEVDNWLLSPGDKALLYVANPGLTDLHHLYRVDIEGARAVALTSGAGSESYPVVAGGEVAVIATDVTHPAHVATVGRTLTPLGERVELTSTVVPQQVRFPAPDGTTVRAQLFAPKGPGPHPAVVFVHGGPRRQMLAGYHPSGYYSNAYAMNQHLASQGYAVLSVNYRSGTGYGGAFRDAPGIARDGAAEYADVLAAGIWLAARPGVDPARIGIWGGSWGGYLTALALARDSDVFAAGVDFHGVHTMLRTVPNSLSPEAQVKARQLQWDSSPFGALDRWKSQVLIVHGDDDRNVDFFQSMLLARELQARAVPFEELVFPNERHAFVRYENWVKALTFADDFFDRRLKAKAR